MLTKTLNTYCRLFNRRHDWKGLELFLKSSPYYPSLLSTVQALKFAGLNVEVGSCDADYLTTLKNPCLLHLRKGKDEMLVVSKWNNRKKKRVVFQSQTNRWVDWNQNFAQKFWDGVVIYTNDNYSKTSQIIDILTGAIMIALIALALISIFIKGNHDILYFIPVLAGLALSIYLFLKSEIQSPSVIDRICHISKTTDCVRVDESKYSKVLGFKMNSLALAFFISQLTCIAIGNLFKISGIAYSLYFIASAISLPVIGYSAYGQIRIKRVCPLCAAVGLCLVIESILFIRDFHSIEAINPNIVILFAGTLLVAIFVLQHISDTRQKEFDNRINNISLLRLKRKKQILLSESRNIRPVSSPLWFGEENAAISIATVISPGCSHCRKFFSEILELHRKGVKFRWDIILGQTTKQDSVTIDDWINRFYSNKDTFLEYLTLWCKGENDISTPLYKKVIDDAMILKIRQSFDNLIAEFNITGFPQIIFKDKLLSALYTPEDLEFLITDEINF